MSQLVRDGVVKLDFCSSQSALQLTFQFIANPLRDGSGADSAIERSARSAPRQPTCGRRRGGPLMNERRAAARNDRKLN